MADWYENHHARFPAQHHAALLMDIMAAQGVDSHKYLKGTGLFLEDIIARESTLSSTQLLKLLRNSRQGYPSEELSFRWGQLLWPGHYGSVSELLNSARDLQSFLNYLQMYRHILCPLLVPKIHFSEHYCFIEWRDAIGIGEQKRFLVEAYNAALVAASLQLSGQALPWRIAFSYARPAADAAYYAHLGPHIHFNWGVDVLIIAKDYLRTPWRAHDDAGTDITRAIAERRSQQQACSAKTGFIEAVQDYLARHIRQSCQQEHCAEALGLSLSTFKRKLKNHHSQYQHLHDRARMLACFRLFCFEGRSNEAVARYLNFNDTTNFRRAFKRWFGLTPSSSKALYDLNLS